MQRKCVTCDQLLVENGTAVQCCMEWGRWLCFQCAPHGWQTNPKVTKYSPNDDVTIKPPAAEPPTHNDLGPRMGHGVDRPKHYRYGSISDIDVAEDWNSPPWIVHALCYLKRWPYKNGIEDLRKARDAIQYQIEALESQAGAEHDG